jgi:hypothetical protein
VPNFNVPAATRPERLAVKAGGDEPKERRMVDVDSILHEITTQKLKKSELQRLLWSLHSRHEIEGNLAPIIEIVASEKGQIRTDAIQVLAKSSSPEVGKALLEVLRTSKSYHDLWWATIGLARSGSEDAIPVLKEFLYRERDLKATSLYAIGEIGKAKYVPLYLSLLADPKYKAKWIAMQAINRYGDETCVDGVIDRFRKVVSKPSQSDGIDELTEGRRVPSSFCAQRSTGRKTI